MHSQRTTGLLHETVTPTASQAEKTENKFRRLTMTFRVFHGLVLPPFQSGQPPLPLPPLLQEIWGPPHLRLSEVRSRLQVSVLSPPPPSFRETDPTCHLGLGLNHFWSLSFSPIIRECYLHAPYWGPLSDSMKQWSACSCLARGSPDREEEDGGPGDANDT